jgi:hypothetical protein
MQIGRIFRSLLAMATFGLISAGTPEKASNSINIPSSRHQVVTEMPVRPRLDKKVYKKMKAKKRAQKRARKITRKHAH